MLVARQYAAQGIWDVSNLQNTGPGVGTRNVQEPIEKALHVRKMCEDVGSNHYSQLSVNAD